MATIELKKLIKEMEQHIKENDVKEMNSFIKEKYDNFANVIERKFIVRPKSYFHDIKKDAASKNYLEDIIRFRKKLEEESRLELIDLETKGVIFDKYKITNEIKCKGTHLIHSLNNNISIQYISEVGSLERDDEYEWRVCEEIKKIYKKTHRKTVLQLLGKLDLDKDNYLEINFNNVKYRMMVTSNDYEKYENDYGQKRLDYLFDSQNTILTY